MHILITGGAGFIGSHLSERLIQDNHTVTVLDDLSTGQMSNLAALTDQPGFNFVEGSILDRALVAKLVKPAEIVFHLAAAVGVKLIMEEPSRSILTNVAGTENVLDAALQNKAHTFIASSSEVYGKTTKFPFCEDDDLTIGATKNLRWSYACAKTLDEFLALAHARESNLPVTVLRFFNTTGPRQTGRYMSGAVLMGLGGVLAGGCTVGAGLSGIPTLSIAAILAIVSIAVGALATNRALNASRAEPAGSSTTPTLLPAE